MIFLWYKNLDRILFSLLPQSTRLTDGQTDAFLVASPRWRSMHRGKNVIPLPSVKEDISKRRLQQAAIPESYAIENSRAQTSDSGPLFR